MPRGAISLALSVLGAHGAQAADAPAASSGSTAVAPADSAVAASMPLPRVETRLSLIRTHQLSPEKDPTDPSPSSCVEVLLALPDPQEWRIECLAPVGSATARTDGGEDLIPRPSSNRSMDARGMPVGERNPFNPDQYISQGRRQAWMSLAFELPAKPARRLAKLKASADILLQRLADMRHVIVPLTAGMASPISGVPGVAGTLTALAQHRVLVHTDAASELLIDAVHLQDGAGNAIQVFATRKADADTTMFCTADAAAAACDCLSQARVVRITVDLDDLPLVGDVDDQLGKPRPVASMAEQPMPDLGAWAQGVEHARSQAQQSDRGAGARTR
jgi:hypothetical protein